MYINHLNPTKYETQLSGSLVEASPLCMQQLVKGEDRQTQLVYWC